MLGNRNKIQQYLRRNNFSIDFSGEQGKCFRIAAAANGNGY